MTFELRALPFPAQTEKGYWFIFSGDSLLIEIKNDVIKIPTTETIELLNILPESSIYLGRIDSIPCSAGSVVLNNLDEGRFQLIGIRQLFGLINEEMFWLAARASHLVNWDRNTQYCGRCGHETISGQNEHSKHCPSCGYTMYPKISPAIIVAITNGNKLLLAHNAMNKSNFYSVLAGFVEPGENLEECVVREVKEEAGIEIKNIRYFGSQPWPFPDSLMVGFTAEYAGGELVLDKNELSDADWFSVEELPPIPGKISVAYKLINWFIENNKTL